MSILHVLFMSLFLIRPLAKWWKFEAFLAYKYELLVCVCVGVGRFKMLVP
jgi:hypothetical protein